MLCTPGGESMEHVMMPNALSTGFIGSRDNETRGRDASELSQSCYEGNSISKLQIQVATYVFELSARNCHR